MSNFVFDFDYWQKLFKENPEEFERQKFQILEDEIKKYEDKNPEDAKRNRSILWNLNTRLSLIKNNTARYNVVIEEFWCQFSKFKEATKDFQELTNKKV